MILLESETTWQQALEAIQRGEIVAFPTDTVYGVGCDPYNVEAIEKIYAAKARSHLKALPLLLSDESVLEKVSCGRNRYAEALATAFWPGALTMVLAKAIGLPDELGSKETIAVRVPNHSDLRSFIELCGGAIAATSANVSGEPDALDANEAEAYLRRHVRLVVDGGKVVGGVPSTVVDCSGVVPVILRAGAISAESINEVIRASEVQDGE